MQDHELQDGNATTYVKNVRFYSVDRQKSNQERGSLAIHYFPQMRCIPP